MVQKNNVFQSLIGIGGFFNLEGFTFILLPKGFQSLIGIGGFFNLKSSSSFCRNLLTKFQSLIGIGGFFN